MDDSKVCLISELVNAPNSWNIFPVQAAPAEELGSRRGSSAHTVLGIDNISWSEEGEEIKDKGKGNTATGELGQRSEKCFNGL